MGERYDFLLWTLAFSAAMGFFAWQIWGRLGVLLKLRTDDGRDYSTKTWGKRLKNTLVYAFGQYKFFRDDQPAGVMHIIIFWGFIVLGGQVVTMFLRGWFPEFQLPLGPFYNHLKDFFEVGVLIAVGIALFRWAITKPERLYGYLPAEKKLRGQSHWEAFVILFFIATIMVSGLVYDHSANELARTASWWTHNLVSLVFLNLLPRSKHFHIITAVANVFLGKYEAKGWLRKGDLTSDTPLFGRSTPDQFTWKQALDMYS